jgi:pyrophosphatase PpaX
MESVREVVPFPVRPASGPPLAGSRADANVPIWICDVNGVLLDSTAIVREAFAATAAHYGFECGAREFGMVKGCWLLEAYRRLDPGGDPQARRAFHLGYVRERIACVRAYPGVRDTLAAARAAGVRIGAATSHGEIAEAGLVVSGLYPLIDVLVTQEEITRPKPHPDAILRVLALLGADLHDPRPAALHVGDTREDIEAGRAADLLTIGVTYGVSPTHEIEAAAPDETIAAFAEMRSRIPARRLSHAGACVAAAE